MELKKQTPKYTAEFRERGVRLYREQRADYASEFKRVRAADRTVRGTVRMRRTRPTARNPELASDRARQDKEDFEEIKAVHGKSRGATVPARCSPSASNAWRRDGSPPASA